MLIIFGGLPGSGKTVLARQLAQRLGAVYLRIDTIEQALRSDNREVGPTGYTIAYHLAEENLRNGVHVIADSVNPLAITRNAWLAVAEETSSKAVEVEVMCSDATQYRHRVEEREADIAGIKLPTWQDVINRKYDAWDRPHIIIDTAHKTMGENFAELLSILDIS